MTQARVDKVADTLPEAPSVREVYRMSKAVLVRAEKRALAAVARNEPARAIELLQANVPYERAVPPTAFNFFFGSLYPVYVRAQAYSASGQHKQAVAEFQKILDHRGLMMGDPAGARALLEKARSLARAGDQRDARAAYEDFLSLWKDADPNVPVLAQAQAEYAKLK
jgi:tetratricopeptide (TPR) repeat protein